MPLPNVIVIDHPVVQTKLAELRDYTADHRKFRALLDEIASLMVYEVTRNWPTTPRPVQTPMERATGRVLAVQGLDAFGGGHEADEADGSGAGALEERDGRQGAAAGGEHGVDEQDFRLADVWGELLVVRDGGEGGLVAVDAEVAEPGLGEQPQHAVGHAEPGAENRHERHPP